MDANLAWFVAAYTATMKLKRSVMTKRFASEFRVAVFVVAFSDAHVCALHASLMHRVELHGRTTKLTPFREEMAPWPRSCESIAIHEHVWVF